MNDADRLLAKRLDDTALQSSPGGSTPDGLIDRVVAASLPLLVGGRARGGHRLRLPVVLARVAVAAVLAMALVAVFWSTPVQRSIDAPDLLPISLAPGDRPSGMLVASGPFTWRDGAMLTLLQVRDMGWDDAVGDLETVVNTVGTGRAGMLGVVGDTTPLDRVESELLTVTRVAGGAS
jgi:hypothetical protein